MPFSPFLDFSFYKGNTHTVQFTIISIDQVTPLDITGATGTLVVSDSTGATVVTVNGTVGAGTDGVLTFKFVPNQTSGLPGNGTVYTYRANLVMPDTSVYTIAVATIVLK